jgi:hypothetical protein
MSNGYRKSEIATTEIAPLLNLQFYRELQKISSIFSISVEIQGRAKWSTWIEKLHLTALIYDSRVRERKSDLTLPFSKDPRSSRH